MHIKTQLTPPPPPVQVSILNYLPDAYPDHAASVLAGNNFVRCVLGAVCVLLAKPMYEGMGCGRGDGGRVEGGGNGCGWASSILGLVGCAFVPVPFLFYFWGGRIRRGSRRAKKDF